MTDHFPQLLTFTRRAGLALLAILLVATVAPKAIAAEGGEHFLSEKVSDELKKLEEFQQAKNWEGAIGFLNKLLSSVKPDSYDVAMLQQFLGKVYYMKGDLHSAIQPLETCLSLSTANKYFKPEAEQELRLFIIQAYFTDATSKGSSLADQKKNYLKALSYMEDWASRSKKTSQEITTLHAYILFGLAQTNLEIPNKIDATYVKKAQVVIEKALTEFAKPKDNLYSLLIGCLQQQENYVAVAEYYELLCKLQPNNKQNWQQLFGTYYQLSQDANPEKAFDYSVRAVVTLDRAQERGHLNTPKDNFNRVAIYFNIQQHDEATRLLQTGLVGGTIEDIIKNWEILIFSYQQIAKDDLAVKAADLAIKRYPDKGSLYMMKAQSYYNMDKPKESYEACLDAIRVGGLERPHTAYSFAANMAFQLRLFDEGLNLVKKAMEYPDAKKDTQLPRLKQALEECIKEREINKQAIEAQHKNLK